MRKKTSIHDVAKELNLSSATISFALNGKANVLMDDNIPVTLLDRYLPSFNTSTVIIDTFSGAYQAVRHLAENVAVVGFDHNTHFYLFTPSITAVAKPIEEISEEVVKRLPDTLFDENESRKRRTVTLPLKLAERNSPRQRTKARLTLKSYDCEMKKIN